MQYVVVYRRTQITRRNRRSSCWQQTRLLRDRRTSWWTASRNSFDLLTCSNDRRFITSTRANVSHLSYTVDKCRDFTLYCTGLRKASFASAVYATTNLSVCLSHSGLVSKRGNAEGYGLHRRVASVSSFLMPRMVDGDDPVQVKFECKEVDALWKQLSCKHFAS